jgi:hypothetical protein
MDAVSQWPLLAFAEGASLRAGSGPRTLGSSRGIQLSFIVAVCACLVAEEDQSSRGEAKEPFGQEMAPAPQGSAMRKTGAGMG